MRADLAGGATGDELTVGGLGGARALDLDAHGHRLAVEEVVGHHGVEVPARLAARDRAGPVIGELARVGVDQPLPVDVALAVVGGDRVAHAPVGAGDRHVDVHGPERGAERGGADRDDAEPSPAGADEERRGRAEQADHQERVGGVDAVGRQRRPRAVVAVDVHLDPLLLLVHHVAREEQHHRGGEPTDDPARADPTGPHVVEPQRDEDRHRRHRREDVVVELGLRQREQRGRDDGPGGDQEPHARRALARRRDEGGAGQRHRHQRGPDHHAVADLAQAVVEGAAIAVHAGGGAVEVVREDPLADELRSVAEPHRDVPRDDEDDEEHDAALDLEATVEQAGPAVLEQHERRAAHAGDAEAGDALAENAGGDEAPEEDQVDLPVAAQRLDVGEGPRQGLGLGERTAGDERGDATAGVRPEAGLAEAAGVAPGVGPAHDQEHRPDADGARERVGLGHEHVEPAEEHRHREQDAGLAQRRCAEAVRREPRDLEVPDVVDGLHGDEAADQRGGDPARVPGQPPAGAEAEDAPERSHRAVAIFAGEEEHRERAE